MRSKQARLARRQCAGRALHVARVTGECLAYQVAWYWSNVAGNMQAEPVWHRSLVEDALEDCLLRQHAEAMVARASR